MNNESESLSGSEVRDRATRPAGLLPRNTQAYLILGVALVMVGAIAFSGGNTSAKQSKTTPKAATVVDPNVARIEDYRARIDDQQRKLQVEQARLDQTKKALGLEQQSAAAQAQPGQPGTGSTPQVTPEEQERQTLEAEKRKREYQSLFASNIVQTYRKEAESKSAEPAAQTADASAKLPAYYPWPYPWQQTGAPGTTGATSPQQDSSQAKSSADRNSGPSDESAREEPERQHRLIDPSLQKADGKSYRLFEGTIIETVLTNRLDGSFNGPVNCMVTTDVYSHDLQHMLIPKGSRVLGEVKRNNALGQQRLAVFFHRVIMPDGYSASLDQFKGLSQIGETGLRDQVNHHYMQVFGVSLAVGALAGLSDVNTGYGLNASTLDAYRQGFGASASQ